MQTIVEKHSEKSYEPRQREDGQFELAIDHDDPMYNGGNASVFIKWADDDSRSEWSQRTQVPYLDQHALVSHVEGFVRAQKEWESNSVGVLRDRLKSFDLRPGKDINNPVVKKIKADIEKLNNQTVYAWKHVKVGVWPTASDARTGRFPPGYTTKDEVFVKSFSSETEVQDLNEQIYKEQPHPVRNFDGEQRAVYFDWRIINA